MLASMSVAEVMTKDVFSCQPYEQLDAMLDVMRTRRFRHVPVVDDDGAVVGILSDRDIRSVSFVSRTQGPSLGDLMVASIPVREVMASEPVTVGADESVVNVLKLMEDNRIGCLPVVEGNKLLGIVTAVDFLKLLRKVLES